MAPTLFTPGRAALSIGACCVVAGAAYLVTRDGGKAPPEPARPAAAVVSDDPGAGAETAPTGAAAVPPAAETPGPVAAETPDPAAPSVDVMRVEAGGAAVVAGTARPGANVSVLAGDRRLAEVKADEAGRFVAIFDAGTATGPRALTLEATEPGGGVARSDQVLLLLPSEAPAPKAEAAAPRAEPSAAVAATAILTPDAARITPVASPPAGADGQVSFASISYGETGAVRLEGFGAAGAPLRIYVDGAFAGVGKVAADGRWSFEIPDAPPGTYTLRVDQVDVSGKVVSRTETPFRRETAAPLPAAPGEVTVVVQPGNSLWTLARIHYGTGVRYSQILDANAKLIADPDLIYPGQIFRVPDQAE
jgi:nucleoid-associated protein YgaU